MADCDTNKIIMQVQVEPTPAVAEPTQPASPLPRAETAEARNLLPTTPDEAHPDARGTQPDRAIPDATAAGPPIPPMAAGSDAGPMSSALEDLELMELDDSILDLIPGEVDDFDGANLDFASALLEDDGEETAQHITEAYNPEAETAPTGQDYSELELGVDGLNLGDSDSDSEDPPQREGTPTETTDPVGMPARGPTSTPNEVEMEERREPLPKQPGLQIGERRIQIKDVGLFRHKAGQPCG